MRVCESSVCLFWLDRADIAVVGFECAQVLFLLQAGLGLLFLHCSHSMRLGASSLQLESRDLILGDTDRPRYSEILDTRWLCLCSYWLLLEQHQVHLRHPCI